MGKDYRIGLIAGSVLAGVAILWVATRPGQAPRPPLAHATQASGPAAGTGGSTPNELPGGVQPGPVTQSRGPSTALRPGTVPLLNPSSHSFTPPAGKKGTSAGTPRRHIVQPGETLSGISRQYYGTPNNWRKILIANGKTLKDADKIAPGTELIIPE